MMRLTLSVGMRTESAMKPMLAIWGMTCSSAAAALVEVSTTLPMAPRLLRRSVAPAFGTVSSTGWEGVTACTVLMPAVIMFFVRSRSRSGRIMWASAVVVHDAAETTLCLAGSNSNSLMPLMNRPESSGSGAPFFLLLNGELFTTTRAPATRWPRMAPFASSGSACGSRNVPVHSTTSATPWSRQWMSFGSRASRRMTSSLPWALMRPRSSSTTVTSRTPDWPCRKRWRAPYVVSLAMYCARASSDVPTGRPRLMTMRSKSSCPRWCHKRQLADAAQPVDAECPLPTHRLRSPSSSNADVCAARAGRSSLVSASVQRRSPVMLLHGPGAGPVSEWPRRPDRARRFGEAPGVVGRGAPSRYH